MPEPRMGFLTVADYLNLPRDRGTWLLKPLIPTSGACLIYGESKLGKAVALTTPILTPTGWRTMGELKVGEQVFGSNGQPVNIVAATEVMVDRPCYEITFKEGPSIVCDAGHEWPIYWDEAYGCTQILTTEEMCNLAMPIRISTPYTGYSAKLVITGIEPVSSVPVRCIEVDAKDHLYLCGENCIPTHNSYLGIQLCLALTGQIPDFLGFPVANPCKVLYLQLDTPRNVWAYRFEELIEKNSLNKDNPNLLLADRENLEHYPFDILQPGHVQYLQALVQYHHAGAVIIDTLREAHSGEEDSSTTSRNVIANLVAATQPAALIIISHSRKPNPDGDRDLLADHRGSSYIVGRMDAIIRLTKTRMFYTGRSIEAGDVKLEREDNGLWAPKQDDVGPAIEKVLADTSLTTLRAKARILAPIIGSSEEAAMSRLRRMGAGTTRNEGVQKHVASL